MNFECDIYFIYTQRSDSPASRAMSNLLIKFKSRDTQYGVTRATLKALAEEMAVSETMAVHLAISRFAREVLPAYERDEGPLITTDVARVRKAAKPLLPKGKVIRKRTLL